MSPKTPTSSPPPQVEMVLAHLDNLPPLSAVAARILTLTDDPRTNAREIVKLIETDPALTARILSLVGRAEHGLRREALTVEKAVVLLGFDTVRQVTLALKVLEVFGGPAAKKAGEGFDRAEFWKHCLGVACAARRIAAAVKSSVRPEEAFVLGLLHDLGKDALNATMPKSYLKVLKKAEEAEADLCDVERLLLGVDHAVVGRRLAERWGLPRTLVETIWLHHHPAEVLPSSIAAGRHVQIVTLADALVREHRVGWSGNRHLPIASGELAAALGLSETGRAEIIQSLAGEIEARAAWIGADDLTSDEVYLKALVRSAEELTTANATLLEQNRRLLRQSRYFSAMGRLNRGVSPQAAVREVCAVAAEALRQALGASSVVVFTFDEPSRWCEAGFSDGNMESDLFEVGGDRPMLLAELAAAAQAALSGAWFLPVGQGLNPLVDRFRAKLRGGSLWLLPIVRERRLLGGSFVSAESELIALVRGDAAELEALSAAIGLAILQSQSQAAAMSLSDELAEANRRSAAMQAELLRSRTLQTVVAMAAGAAHELNNPLAVISGRAQLLRGQTQDAKVREALELIDAQAQACSDIVTDLMNFARPTPPAPEPIELRPLLENLLAALVAGGAITSEQAVLELPSHTPCVRFDRVHLERLFQELLTNAVEATDSANRRLTVKASMDLTEENLVVTVADNGRGMTPEVRSRAADPFFSHRPAGRGRGLGLARVQQWLHLNAGSMRIESEPGRGTRVELRLPVAGSGG